MMECPYFGVYHILTMAHIDIYIYIYIYIYIHTYIHVYVYVYSCDIPYIPGVKCDEFSHLFLGGTSTQRYPPTIDVFH